jgi:hypothetical protein
MAGLVPAIPVGAAAKQAGPSGAGVRTARYCAKQ